VLKTTGSCSCDRDAEVRYINRSNVNKDWTPKDKDKDLILKDKDNDKDLPRVA